MKSVLQQLTAQTQAVFQGLGYDPSFGVVTVSDRPDLGHYQCNGALAVAKQAGKNPREIAEQVVKQLIANEWIANATIAGPGFINIEIDSSALTTYVSAMMQDDQLGVATVEQPQQVTVDYGGLNVAKPMHVGHLRSLMIGESIKRVFTFLGHTTTSDVHLGDWGLQMGMVIMGIKEEQPDLPYFDESITDGYPDESPVTLEDLERIYPSISGRTKEDDALMQQALQATAELQDGRPGYRALWHHIVDVSLLVLKKETEFLGVHFDLWNGESDYHDLMPRVVDAFKAKGIAQDHEGALIVSFDDAENPSGIYPNEMPPLYLQKSDGSYLYATSDLATIYDRFVGDIESNDEPQDLCIYVVDSRQSLHFQQVFRSASMIGWLPPITIGSVFHVGFGTMNGPDGKPFKTRSGGSMKLWSLVEEAIEAAYAQMDSAEVAKEYDDEERARIAQIVALAALKFADLQNEYKSNYIFDLERFTKFEGKTGPYLLYSAVRMKSILRSAQERGYDMGALHNPQGSEDQVQAQLQLMLKMVQYPEVVHAVHEHYAPHFLAQYVYELSQAMNGFYQHCHILAEEDAEQRGSWLTLAAGSAAVLEHGLYLLGIEVPEHM